MPRSTSSTTPGKSPTSHYWRRRGAKTVLGGIVASTCPGLCAAYFDAVAVGDPESTVPAICDDFRKRRLQPLYVATAYDPASTPTPRYDLVAGRQVLPIAVEATRGCPFTCDFCTLTGAGTPHQVRPPHSVVRDLLAGRRNVGRFSAWHKRNVAIFYDNNLGGQFRPPACALRRLGAPRPVLGRLRHLQRAARPAAMIEACCCSPG